MAPNASSWLIMDSTSCRRAPNELVFMDYSTVLLDDHGYKGLLLLVDHFTSWVEAIPVKSESAEELAQAIYNWWII
jgi:hypothetical protein